MPSHLIGSASAGWLDLSGLAPYDGGTAEYIQDLTVSLGGVTTMNRRAIKRRWSLPLPIADPWREAQLVALAEAQGPFWLYDGLRPGLVPPDPKLMRGWVDSTGVVGVPSADARLALVATRTYAWTPLTAATVAQLFKVPAGSPSITLAVTAKAVAAGNILTMGMRWYDAAGVQVGAPVTATKSLTTAEARYANAWVPPAGALYGQPTLLSALAGTVVTDPSVGPVDPGPAWYVVLFDGYTDQHHNNIAHSLVYTLREV